MNNLVSVIIPCYNQSQYLPDALNSIYHQSYSNWECIIVNDGSTDDTETIAIAWQQKDSRFKYIKKENGGLSSARNAGLNQAKGDFIQFLDADDVLHPTKFKVQLEAANYYSLNSVCYSDYFSSTADNLDEEFPYHVSPRFNSSRYLIELINRWENGLSIPCHCFLISSNLINENKIRFDSSLKNHEDWDFWMTIFRYQPEVFYTPEKLVTYRIHSLSMSRDYKKMRKGFLEAITKQKKLFKSSQVEFFWLWLKYYRVKYRITRESLFIKPFLKIIDSLRKK